MHFRTNREEYTMFATKTEFSQQNARQIWGGSFSAVSKPIFASKYSFCRGLQAEQALRICAMVFRWDFLGGFSRQCFKLKKMRFRFSDFGEISKKYLQKISAPSVSPSGRGTRQGQSRSDEVIERLRPRDLWTPHVEQSLKY